MKLIEKARNCQGCAKRKEYLRQKKRDAQAWFKRGTNAARRLLSAPSPRNSPLRDRSRVDGGKPKAGGTRPG